MNSDLDTVAFAEDPVPWPLRRPWAVLAGVLVLLLVVIRDGQATPRRPGSPRRLRRRFRHLFPRRPGFGPKPSARAGFTPAG